MKCTIKEINKLVEQIRSGQLPKLPEGKREEHYYDPALPGFYIRALNTGVASWTVQWKSFGRQKKIALGDVKVLERTGAIKAGRELLAKITLDRLDPHAAKRERMHAAKVTFASLVPLFMKAKKLRPGVVKSWKSYLTGYYFKRLHNLPIDEIIKNQIQTCIDEIAAQSGARAAGACHTALHVLFNWAHDTGKLPEGHYNPASKIQLPAINGPRKRVLTNDEIQLIWKTCELWEAEALRVASGMRKRGGQVTADIPRAIMLLFLTGCRAQEIGDLKWSEIDLDNGELKIPAERTKNAQILFNPLSTWAVQILRRVERRPGTDFVFGRSRIEDTGVRLQHARDRLDEKIRNAAPPQNWTIHDIRRTFRTRLAQLGVTKDVGEALLGHTGHRTEVEEVYDLYERWPEKRQALTMWETNLRAIIDGTAEKITRGNFGERKEGGTP
jgi:integrase